MKLRLMITGMLLSGVLAAAPLQAAEEPADNNSIEKHGSAEPVQEKVEAAVPAARTAPAETNGTGDGGGQAQVSVVPAAEAVERPVEDSWWADVKYLVGIGSDPHPGETV